MYTYLKALHIVFVVTWFAGLFYMPRLFIYNVEAGTKSPEECAILRNQFKIMIKRLWFGITWPSAIITLIFGLSVLFSPDYKWYVNLLKGEPLWLFIKLCFVILLYVYHYSLHIIYKQQMNDNFKYSSQQLRIWNEVATVFLIAIVMLVVVKQSLSFVWGIVGLLIFVVILMMAIKVYKKVREGKK